MTLSEMAMIDDLEALEALEASFTASQEIKDSGERREFSSGAKRDRGAGKQYRRYDLLPTHALHLLAMHYGKGAAKYAARNWEKGMPLSEFYNSAESHALKLACGYDDEPHAEAWLWNAICFLETRERIRLGLLPPELDDMDKTMAGRTPPF